MGITAAISQIFYINAIYADKAGRVTSLFILNIVFGYSADILYFKY